MTVSAATARAEEIKVDCPKNLPAIPKLARDASYKDVPFKAGESAVYQVTWAGIQVGNATLDVRAPRMDGGRWQRVFHVDANTDDSFKSIYVAKDSIEATSHPWDFGIDKFYMEQNEGKIFSDPILQKKWLDFDQPHCKVHERTDFAGKPEERAEHDLFYGAMDALGVVYYFRTKTFKVGRIERAPVYTSEKNWWLEADPVALEQVTVPAGTFNTVKLKLTTFLGKELQQKGDVWAWYSVDTPAKQLVQIQGDIKLGSVWVKLASFRPGS